MFTERSDCLTRVKVGCVKEARGFHTTALFGLLLPLPRGRPLATNPNNLLQRAKAP
jgi:hypothetical protein